MRRVLASIAFSCPGVSSDFPLALSETPCPCSPVKPSFTSLSRQLCRQWGGCQAGVGVRLRRKHSSCLTEGREKLLWKVKDRQHPNPVPPKKDFPQYLS